MASNEKAVAATNAKIEFNFKGEPRRYNLKGKWLGVGGQINIKRKPPLQDTVIPEANINEYKQIFENCPVLGKML